MQVGSALLEVVRVPSPWLLLVIRFLRVRVESKNCVILLQLLHIIFQLRTTTARENFSLHMMRQIR